MATRTVNLYARDLLGGYIASVLLRIFTAAGVYETEGTTDGNGKLGPLLIDDGDHHVAAAKVGVVFSLPYVLEITQDEDFDLAGEIVATPTATDARRCRLSGYVRDGSGAPITGAVFAFLPYNDALSVDGALIGTWVEARTDDDGYIDVELYREQKYRVRAPIPWYALDFDSPENDLEDQGFTEKPRSVPDQSALTFAYFIHPRPARVQFNKASVSVAADDTDTTVEATVLLTNGIDSETGETDALEYTSSDEDVATVVADEAGVLTITGVAAGAATVQVTRRAYPPVYVPDTALVVDTMDITVT